MSPYEILAVAALAAAGGFAWYLYRSDIKPGAPQRPESESGAPMFGREKGKRQPRQ